MEFSKEKLKAFIDVNDDGAVNFQDVLMVAVVMVGGYFIIKTGLKYFKKG